MSDSFAYPVRVARRAPVLPEECAPTPSVEPPTAPSPPRARDPAPRPLDKRPMMLRASDTRAADRARLASEVRRAKIGAATAALDSMTRSLFTGGLKAAATSEVCPPSKTDEVLRLPSSALWVGNLRASVASTVRVFPDRFEYEFQHPRRPKTIHMSMRFVDMTSCRICREGGELTSDPRGKGSWISFDVRGPLEQFASDPEARVSRSSERGRRHLLIEFPSPAAIDMLKEAKLSGLQRVWPTKH